MTAVKKINDTTFSADGLGDTSPAVIIGGKDESKFIPNVNMSFHDDEFFINLNRTGKQAKTGTFSEAKITGDDTDDFYIDDNGHLKWDVIFSECPENLTLEWKIKNSNGIDFFYQGELTAEEIADGCIRPDYIVGSYAVYCDKKNNKYLTGKLCHIPRPFVIDNDNKTEWCVLKIENNTLTITLPETFMQNATYPVRLDPTFGYTSQGGSYGTTYAGFPRGSIYGSHNASTGDIITSFSLYAKYISSPTTVDMAAYSISSGHLDARLSDGISINVSSSDMTSITSSTVSQYMTNGVSYGLAWLAADTIQIAYDDGTGYMDVPEQEGELPSTWTHSSFIDGIYSVYATYTEGTTTTANDYYYKQNQ